MEEFHQDIKITGVDKDHIRESAAVKGTWIIPFKLSVAPDESWSRHFYELHRKNMDLKKKDSKLIGDCIEVNFTDTDDQQAMLDILNREVTEANTLYKSVNQQKQKMRDDMKALQQKQSDMLQKLKDNSDKLRF